MDGMVLPTKSDVEIAHKLDQELDKAAEDIESGFQRGVRTMWQFFKNPRLIPILWDSEEEMWNDPRIQKIVMTTMSVASIPQRYRVKQLGEIDELLRSVDDELDILEQGNVTILNGKVKKIKAIVHGEGTQAEKAVAARRVVFDEQRETEEPEWETKIRGNRLYVNGVALVEFDRWDETSIRFASRVMHLGDEGVIIREDGVAVSVKDGRPRRFGRLLVEVNTEDEILQQIIAIMRKRTRARVQT